MAGIPTSKLPQPPLDGAHYPADKVEDSRCQNLVQSRVKRLSSAVEKTVDRLSRSVGGVSPPSSAPTSPTTRRVFSLSRKNRIERDSPGMLSTSVAIPPTSEFMPIITRSQSNNATTSHSEDSPFIRPPSPPIRPSLRQSLGGDGSMRAGTQTLIQALQALPWTSNSGSDNEDDVGAGESGSEDDEQPQIKRLASSIHTIHRPLARSHRLPIPNAHKASPRPSPMELGDLEDASSSEELENDFEETPRLTQAVPSLLEGPDESPSETAAAPQHEYEGTPATIRLHRRIRLAEKLKEVFELDGIHEVLAEMPCWLMRSVLLQGYIYMTNSYLCFFAHMPSREDQILKSGSLNKKAQRTKRWIKHWFVLKNDALSWYQSSVDPYFPHGIYDLRYAVSCDPHGDKGFRLRSNSKTITLSADSVPSREEWVKAIRKVIFKAQNMGDSVKIAIPYSAVLDVERSSAMDFSETIEVKVIDKDDNLAVDSYFFAYFHNFSDALDQIRGAVRDFRRENFISGQSTLLDTTSIRVQPSTDRSTTAIESPKPTTGFRLSSLFRPFSDTSLLSRASAPPASDLNGEDYTHIRRKDDSSFIPITSSPTASTSISLPRQVTDTTTISSRQTTLSLPVPDHTYPPSNSSSMIYPNLSSLNRDSNSSWGLGVPSWLKSPRKVFTGSLSMPDSQAMLGTPVKEIYSSAVPSPGPIPATRSCGAGDLTFSILETPDMAPDQELTEKFRTAFAYDVKETLLGYFSGYIYRLLPVFGKLYVSTNYFCFKSSGPLAARTRMILPIRDILASEKSKASRFGHHGLTIIIKGHEELFFEFGAEDKRDAFVQLLDRQIEDVRKRLASGDSVTPSSGAREALILEEFEAQTPGNESDPSPPTDSMADSLPAVMFTSASSTFLTFKPKKPLHFTFLTIGSRGDVQPYIALAQGLMADGHTCRIATHGEFKEWVESYGIQFGYVGGDPAELLRICIENGTFTVAFLKEGLLKFRGWVDDLLKTSWESCQGTDILIESPSAMGGYHIAEALRIPYFRAFTMTWTRTRAYPHAFAVPERKMGGSYNYMSYVMFDQVFWRATAGQINRWRRNTLLLPPTSLDKMEPHKIPFLYNFSPHVVPPPLDWPEWIRVTGYWFLNDADVSAKKWVPPESLISFIDKAHNSGSKVVYIGFGSIVVPDPKAMTHCVIEAVLRSGVYAILSKGWSDRLQSKTTDASEHEEPLPSQIYPIPSVPHDWLFKRIDAACHHGGAGTTGASLRAGIPTIIHPFFGDQFFWADRVEALGVGSGVRKLTISTLSEALVTATTDTKQISKARLLGEQIRAEDGVATAIESIYRDLEYARSLIKQRTVDNLAEELIAEDSTIRNQEAMSPYSFSSIGSDPEAPSEDWSVISDQDERQSSVGSRSSGSRKRGSLTAAVLTASPDSLFRSSSQHRII